MAPVSKVARNLVRQVIGTAEESLTTRQIYHQLSIKFPKHTYVPERGSQTKTDKAHVSSQQPSNNQNSEGFAIQSMRHLKFDVLRELTERGELQKIHTRRQTSQLEHSSKAGKSKRPDPSQVQGSTLTDVWAWRFTPAAKMHPIPTGPTDTEPPIIARPDPPRQKTQLEMYPIPENNHLNKRRQQARPAKERRDKAWAAEVRRVMKEGAKEARANPNLG